MTAQPRPIVAALAAVATLALFNAAIVTGDWIILAALGALIVIVASAAVLLARVIVGRTTAHDHERSPRGDVSEDAEDASEASPRG